MIASFYMVVELIRWQFRSPKANVLENKEEAAWPFRSKPSQTASLVTQLVKNPPAVQETWVQSLGGNIPWRREGQPTPVLLPGKPHGQRSLGAIAHGAAERQTRLSTHTHTHICDNTI